MPSFRCSVWDVCEWRCLRIVHHDQEVGRSGLDPLGRAKPATRARPTFPCDPIVCRRVGWWPGDVFRGAGCERLDMLIPTTVSTSPSGENEKTSPKRHRFAPTVDGNRASNRYRLRERCLSQVRRAPVTRSHRSGRKTFRVDLERSLSSSLVRPGPPQSAYCRGALACRDYEVPEPL